MALLLLHREIAALEDERLHPVLGADAEPVGAEEFGDLHHRAAFFKTEIADDDISLIDQPARAAPQRVDADAQIDIAISSPRRRPRSARSRDWPCRERCRCGSRAT